MQWPKRKEGGQTRNVMSMKVKIWKGKNDRKSFGSWYHWNIVERGLKHHKQTISWRRQQVTLNEISDDVCSFCTRPIRYLLQTNDYTFGILCFKPKTIQLVFSATQH
jgi:hypothetical protein